MKLFKNSKRTQKFSAIAAASLAFLAVGCGKQRAGQYQGLEIAHSSGSTLPSQVVLTIQETQSDLVSGTWNTEFSSGTFTGTLKSDQIQNVLLSKTSSSSASGLTNTGSAAPGYSNSTSYMAYDGSVVCLGRYMGSLKFDGNTVSGSLTPSSSLYQGVNLCTQIDVNASKVD